MIPTCGLVLAIILAPREIGAQERQPIDRAIEAFWEAEPGKEAERAAGAIIASGASFAAVFERLAEGRPYDLRVDTGEMRWPTLSGGGTAHATTIVVPKSYDPAEKYPVRVFLHGGVARPEPEGAEDPGALSAKPGRPARGRKHLEFKERYIAVYPSGYVQAQWWFLNQLANLDVILDRLKRKYNVDENRVHLMGVSDGGTGALFVALRNPTPWSVFFPLNGFLRVLGNPLVGAEGGELFTTNLTNRPIYAVNGELDPLYPIVAVLPTLLMLEKAGASVVFRPMMGAGHETSWWGAEVNAVDGFEEKHPRNPLPVSLSWETERVDRNNRMAWLIVDQIAPQKADDATFPDNNTLEIQEPGDFGLRVEPRRGDGRKILDIAPGTTAAAMGLKKGDTIVRMDAIIVRTAGDIGRAFDEHEAGTPLAFEVDRKGQRLTMEGVFPLAPKPPRREEAFKHSKPSGRVSVIRNGNRFEARTRGVGAFTLLLSPTVVDFGKPVSVTVNGKTVFEGAVERSLETLLRYAARDNDRAMLFGAELKVTVP